MSITHEMRRDSYAAIKPSAPSRRAIILDILGSREMTATEIAETLYSRGITPHYERNFAAPRLTELQAEGKVIAVGKRLCEKTGRVISVWRRVKGR